VLKPLDLKHASLKGIKKEHKDAIVACRRDLANVTWDDVVGVDEARQLLEENVLGPIQDPSLYADVGGGQPSKGMLLFGPPGTGKTMIAKAVASQLGFHFFDVKCGDIFNKHTGEAEKLVDALFVLARLAEPGAIIFLDECDSLLCNGTGKNACDHNKVVNEFKAAWDGVSSGEGRVFVLAATNNPWDIESAVMREGRMDFKLLVSYPNRNGRLSLLKKMLSTFTVDGGDATLEWLADQLTGYSGAKIVTGICKGAQMGVVKDALSMGIVDPGQLRALTRHDFELALHETPRPDPDEVVKHEEWNEKYGTKRVPS